MSRWTRNGWTTCLGGGFDISEWDGRHATDFENETKARRGGDATYMQRVQRLEWMAQQAGETNQKISNRAIPDPQNPWYSLAFLQRMIMAENQQPQEDQNHQSFSFPIDQQAPEHIVKTKIELLMERRMKSRGELLYQPHHIFFPQSPCPTCDT
jgi:hypothetical protein